MVGIERDVIQPGLFPRHDRLGTNWVVLVEVEVEDVHLCSIMEVDSRVMLARIRKSLPFRQR